MPNGNGPDLRPFLNSKLVALFAYFPFLCIIPLLVKKEDPFTLSHGKQGLVIFVGEIGVFILSILFPWIFKAGIFILFVISFVGIIAVLNGKTIQFPVISRLADKISL